jgi:hypothetical protein
MNNLTVGPQNPIQTAEMGKEASQVDGHPVVPGSIDNQPSQGATEPRTSFTELARRIATVLTSFIQHFTGRTESKPVTGEAVPAAGETPAEAPTISNPKIVQTFHHGESPDISNPTSIIKADPPSPDAAGAGYKTAALVVGETPVRIYAKNPATLGEIQKTLSKPGLLDADKLTGYAEKFEEDLTKLGFAEEDVMRSVGLCFILTDMQSFITGNDEMRMRNINSPANQGKAEDDPTKMTCDSLPFQSCQTSDAAKTAGSKAFAATNSLIKQMGELATKCKGLSPDNERAIDARKQILEELTNICSSPDLQVTTLERNVGNNKIEGQRTYVPLSQSIGTYLGSCLRDETNRFSYVKLQKLANDHDHEFIERMVQTAYTSCPIASERPGLKAAYEKYCRDNGKPPTDLDRLVFNNDLKTLFNERDKAIESIKEMKLPEVQEKEQIALCQKSVEQRFQTWLGKHADKHDDGSVTIDVGHKKIMVNADQLGEVTLKSLGAL